MARAKSQCAMKKGLTGVLLFLVIIFGWHLFVGAFILRGDVCLDDRLPPVVVAAMASDHSSCKVSVNLDPNLLTNVVICMVPGPRPSRLTTSDTTTIFWAAFQRDFTPTMERQASDYARRYFDLYAIILPYRVITVERSYSPPSPNDANHSPSSQEGDLVAVPPTSSSDEQPKDSKYADAQLPADPGKYRKIEIRTATCSYISTEGGVMCKSEAAMGNIRGGEIKAILTCYGKWESCRRLASGQTYGFDFVEDRQRREECGPASGSTDCFKLHGQQYDLIYIVSDVSGH